MFIFFARHFRRKCSVIMPQMFRNYGANVLNYAPNVS